VILQQLYEYRTELDLPPIGYAPQRVHWIIDLDDQGNLEGFVRLPEDRVMHAPAVLRGTDITPRVLLDNAEYVLGILRPGATDNQRRRVASKHEAFVALVKVCAEATQEPSVAAVLAFLEGGPLCPEDCAHSDTLTFRVADEIPIELPSVQGFWAQKLEEMATKDAPTMQCLVTGEVGPVPRILPGSLKGLKSIGGDGTGCSLFSAKNPSTHHFGREGAHNFPISWGASERIYSVLSNLIAARKKNSMRIGDMIFVFWSKVADTSFFVTLDSPPKPEQLADLLGSPFTGKEIHGVAGDEFYVLALRAASKRANIRDYFDAPVVRAKANLRRWFDTQQRVGEKLLSVWDLARTYYSDQDKMFSSVVIDLVHTAVMGERLPTALLAKVVARNRAERSVSYARAMLLELFFEYTTKGGEMDREAIKTCGRLLAEFEAVRREGGSDSQGQYYSVVVNNPARGLAMIEKRSRPYFKRLRRDKPGLAHILEARIDALTMGIGAEYPTNLNLEEQGLFALGYRQQRAEDTAEIKERVAARESKEMEVEYR
jgi:CRISPR-associated protein Csd1